MSKLHKRVTESQKHLVSFEILQHPPGRYLLPNVFESVFFQLGAKKRASKQFRHLPVSLWKPRDSLSPSPLHHCRKQWLLQHRCSQASEFCTTGCPIHPAPIIVYQASLLLHISMRLSRKTTIPRKSKDNKPSVRGFSQKHSHISKPNDRR